MQNVRVIDRDADTPGVFLLGVIRDNQRYLLQRRNSGRVPTQELLDDIRAYDYILRSEEAEQLAIQYYDRARRMDPRPRPRDIARAMGWMK